MYNKLIKLTTAFYFFYRNLYIHKEFNKTSNNDYIKYSNKCNERLLYSSVDSNMLMMMMMTIS